MKNKISKILLSSTLCTSLAYGVSFEYPQIYKDQKTIGMGGASVATGGTAASLFSNPAGLSKIKKADGWQVNIIDTMIAVNHNIIDFGKDLDDIDAEGNEETQEVLKLLNKYTLENLHLSTNVSILNVSKNFDKYAFSIMPISGVYLNMLPNAVGSLLEANYLGYGGVALGVSRKLDYSGYGLTNINVGIGLKAIQYQSYNGSLSITEIVDNKDDLLEYITDETEDGTSIVADLGVQAQAYENLDVGLSIMNIGSIGDKDVLNVPMTVNAGVAYTINRADKVFFDKFVVAADYIDMFEGYEQDGDILKRTRLGVNAHLVDGWLGSMSLQAGMYQGYPSYGFDLKLTVLKLAYTSYAEEVGPESGEYEDRRHMVNISIGW